MKHVLSALILTSFLVLPAIMYAQEGAPTIFSTKEALVAQINTIGNWIFATVLLVAGIFLTIAGFFFVTAAGSPEKLKKANEMLINSIIGVVVAVAAKGIVAVVSNLLGYSPSAT